MTNVKPPIAPDVAEVIGDFAEKVENRSLLLDKFVLHKSWPQAYVESSPDPVKMDDASRWSFIRLTQNGDTILRQELDRCRRESDRNRPNARMDKIEKAELKAEILDRMMICKCRNLPGSLASEKLAENRQFAKMIGTLPGASMVVYGELQGRLIVNLSDSLIQNAGMCLDRLTGLPYIPGSAVKGVTRHVALEHLRAGKWTILEFQKAFGSSEVDFGEKGELREYASKLSKDDYTVKGAVDFLAAQPISEPKIVVDISNVHYPDYYQSGVVADLAKEKPRPNTFPVVETGVRYAFCAVANGMGIGSELFAKTRELLVEAITVKGIGAKTGAGYGWFKDISAEIERERQRQIDAENVRKAAEAAEAKAIEDEKIAIARANRSVLEKWAELTVKAIANGPHIKNFNGLSEAEKVEVVRALQMSDGIGHDVWDALNHDKKLLKFRMHEVIRGFCNNHRDAEGKKDLGKMP